MNDEENSHSYLQTTTKDEENSHSYVKHDKKRRRSSVTPSTTTGEPRPISNPPRTRKENAGVMGRAEGRGGQAYKAEGGLHSVTITRTRAPAGARYGDPNVDVKSKPRHFPVIGSFKPPPPPTRAPLTQIRNQNKQNITRTQNTQNAHFTTDKHKDAIKSTVTYVENHKGELEIIKYKNRKRGSVVAFDPDLEAQGKVDELGQQHRGQYQQLSIEGHAEQYDNQYHELCRVVSRNEREYAKELYHLFKRDLRDWEEREEIKGTGVLRANISVDPRLLTMENPYHDIDKMEDVHFDGEPPKATVDMPKTPQQSIRQPEARELQYHYNITGNYNGAPVGVAYNSSAVGRNGNSAYYNGAPYGVANYNNNNGGAANAATFVRNVGQFGMQQQPQQHQHGVANFVQVISDEEHRRNIGNNITQQQQQQMEQMAWVTGAGVAAMSSAPMMGENSYMVSRHGRD